MTSSTVSLSSPLTLPCGQVLPNRIMKSALSEGLGTEEHSPDDRLERLYARWGAGGYGLLVTGNVMVDRRFLGEPGNVVIEDDRDADALTRWAKTAKDGGSPIWMQLNHPGRQGNPITTDGRTVAPSAVGVTIPGIPAPRELTDTEIRDIITRFATAAVVAEECGFDGVQIHAAHGYLVSQFLSPLSNLRTDAWGGDIDHRARFLIEVVRAVRAAVAPGFAVGVKLNSADFQRGGFTEDESRAVVEMLSRESIDLIEISGGSYESPAMMGKPTTASASTRAREAYFLDYAATVRSAAPTTPIAVTGGFRSETAMSEAVTTGDCDLVGLGRPTAVVPGAAADVISGRTPVLDSADLALRLPARLRTSPSVKSIEGALDLQWHTDQLHAMGADQDPDPRRPLRKTAVTTIKRNGVDAFRSKRAVSVATDQKAALRKFRRERLVGRYVANPTVLALRKLGVRTHLATELETTGRTTGLTRRVPVAAAFDDGGAWIISQHGERSGWGRNIAADPEVRIMQGSTWRTGRAHFRHDDDVAARMRTFSSNAILASLNAAGFRALQSDPISVRIDFTD
ncbi:nitroreductase/quinone reductase family protein [Williamsia sp. MIQD14]|uniref:nitroreductase/quinone reductase family protein n=1 Tax=Williamsia sp. MIQD14 TaxID=3425703 RepID=UPI003DA11553